MAEYIEREAVLNRIQKLQGTDTATVGKKQFSEGFFLGLDEAEIVILQTPTADVAEVVRCKDCAHSYYEYHREYLFCARRKSINPPMLVDKNHFCGCGERKDTDGTK